MKRILWILSFFVLVNIAPVYAAPANGTVKEEDGQGRLKSILKYKKGKLVRKRIFHHNGQLILDTVYRNGEPVKSKTYDLDGKLKKFWEKE